MRILPVPLFARLVLAGLALAGCRSARLRPMDARARGEHDLPASDAGSPDAPLSRRDASSAIEMAGGDAPVDANASQPDASAPPFEIGVDLLAEVGGIHADSRVPIAEAGGDVVSPDCGAPISDEDCQRCGPIPPHLRAGPFPCFPCGGTTRAQCC